MKLSSAEVARIVGGSVEGSNRVQLTGAEVDSRRVRPGDLFVALRGARSDGHAFVDQAMAIAGAALVRFDAEFDAVLSGRALIRVGDPLEAYWKLARHERREYGWRIAAVTGSVGKTTTKGMLSSLLESELKVGATSGNRNSTLGLPAELLSQPDEIEVFVAEAGMNRPGELDTIGSLITPQVLLYTRIAPVHTAFFPDLDGIISAKAELLAHLDPTGTLVINADDPHQREFPSKTSASVMRFGAADADAHISRFEDRGLLGSRFTLNLPSGVSEVELPLAGGHQAENLLAAATAAEAFGVGAGTVAEVAPFLEPAPRRGRVHRLSTGVTVVDDSYNASPLAVHHLLGLLAAASGRRIAVLGEMYELGNRAIEAHREAGREAAGACDVLVAVGGEDAVRIAGAARDAGLPNDAVHHVDDADSAADVLRTLLEPDDIVLVKGSRGVGLDRTVDLLLERGAA